MPELRKGNMKLKLRLGSPNEVTVFRYKKVAEFHIDAYIVLSCQLKENLSQLSERKSESSLLTVKTLKCNLIVGMTYVV